MARCRTDGDGGLLAIGPSLAALPRPARADRIRLRGGGEITGVIVKDAAPARRSVLVQTATAAKPLTFAQGPGPRGRSASPARSTTTWPAATRSSPPRRPSTTSASGARRQKLTGPAADPLPEGRSRLDPQFGPAHKKLGHVQHGRSLADLRRAARGAGARQVQGQVDLAGREGQDRRPGRALGRAVVVGLAAEAAPAQALRRRPGRRASRPRSQIAAIRDPAADPGPDPGLLGRRRRRPHPPGAAPRRRSTGPEATEALVELIVAEADPDVRQSMLDELIRRHDPDTDPRCSPC